MEEVGFDLIGFTVLIHAPAGATEDALDQGLNYVDGLDLEVVIEDTIYAEMARWEEEIGLQPPLPLTITVEVT